nr:hypothetical protein [uncultured Flavobacterium sp.]
MKTIKWFILTSLLFAGLMVNAQQKADTGTKITMQFEDQKGGKTYNCSTVYYTKDSGYENSTFSTDIQLTCYGLADNKILEWAANSKVLGSMKITIYESGKIQREYLLQNVSLIAFSEGKYQAEETIESNSTYNLSIGAEQIIINGVQMKYKKY